MKPLPNADVETIHAWSVETSPANKFESLAVSKSTHAPLHKNVSRSSAAAATTSDTSDRSRTKNHAN